MPEFESVMGGFRCDLYDLPKRRLIRSILRIDADAAGNTCASVEFDNIVHTPGNLQPILEQHDRIGLIAGIGNVECGCSPRNRSGGRAALLRQQPLPAIEAKAEIPVQQRIIDQRRIIIEAGPQQQEVIQLDAPRCLAEMEHKSSQRVSCSGEIGEYRLHLLGSRLQQDRF
ncbi:hypothetical protein D3C74_347110 [compost metagenome]